MCPVNSDCVDRAQRVQPVESFINQFLQLALGYCELVLDSVPIFMTFFRCGPSRRRVQYCTCENKIA